MRSMRLIDAMLVWAGLAPSKEPQVRGRPAQEIIAEINEREREEVERVQEAIEEVRRDPTRKVTWEEFRRELDAREETHLRLLEDGEEAATQLLRKRTWRRR